jgi:formylglycine-generating enzyme required for sulfatase activity
LLEEREGLSKTDANTLQARLAALGYAMQAEGEGTTFSREQTLTHLEDETALYHAKSASLLTGDDELRFTHQLLQEYFAARYLRTQMKAGVPATDFFPPENWWENNVWSETAILLMGLYSDNPTPVLNWLREAQPELAARGLTENQLTAPEATLLTLREAWLPRLTDLTRDPQPQARAAVGRALGRLQVNDHSLDNRPGVGLTDEGLPDIDWIDIPSGYFLFGVDRNNDNEAQNNEPDLIRIDLPFYYIARYPVTTAQYEAFVRSDGYTNRSYWTDSGWKWNKNLPPSDYPPITNLVMTDVSWYEAYAYSQWLSTQYGHPTLHTWLAEDPSRDVYNYPGVRLLTEAEWVKAARGGLILSNGHKNPNPKRAYQYRWGKPEPVNSNIIQPVHESFVVGIFPQDESPYGVMDMTVNVGSWLLSIHERTYKYPESNDLGSLMHLRVVRGDIFYNRISHRTGYPQDASGLVGFRLAMGE